MRLSVVYRQGEEREGEREGGRKRGRKGVREVVGVVEVVPLSRSSFDDR